MHEKKREQKISTAKIKGSSTEKKTFFMCLPTAFQIMCVDKMCTL